MALGGGSLTAESYRTQVGRIAPRVRLLEQQVATWRAAASEPAQASAAARAELVMAVRQAAAEAEPSARRALVRRLWPLWAMDATGVEPIRSGVGVASATPAPDRIVRLLRVAL